MGRKADMTYDYKRYLQRLMCWTARSSISSAQVSAWLRQDKLPRLDDIYGFVGHNVCAAQLVDIAKKIEVGSGTREY